MERGGRDANPRELRFPEKVHRDLRVVGRVRRDRELRRRGSGLVQARGPRDGHGEGTRRRDRDRRRETDGKVRRRARQSTDHRRRSPMILEDETCRRCVSDRDGSEIERARRGDEERLAALYEAHVVEVEFAGRPAAVEFNACVRVAGVLHREPIDVPGLRSRQLEGRRAEVPGIGIHALGETRLDGLRIAVLLPSIRIEAQGIGPALEEGDPCLNELNVPRLCSCMLHCNDILASRHSATRASTPSIERPARRPVREVPVLDQLGRCGLHRTERLSTTT